MACSIAEVPVEAGERPVEELAEIGRSAASSAQVAPHRGEQVARRGGGAGAGARHRARSRATRKMSAPSRRKTPCMPVCEAIPASFAFMLSNSGPSVSVSS